MENRTEVPQKTKNRTTTWYNNVIMQYTSGKNENTIIKRYTHLNVHSITIYNSQDMKAIQMSINRWMDKDDIVYLCLYIYIYTHTRVCVYTQEYYSAIRMNSAICIKVDGPREYYTVLNVSNNKSDKDKDCIISFICEV